MAGSFSPAVVTV